MVALMLVLDNGLEAWIVGGLVSIPFLLCVGVAIEARMRN